ncbi:AAA family ATPase [Archangium lansingense]|uniref:ATP-binding protein n=1 Tax=Archangium lansingense TaxID=2995310 RepID=A0ABT4AM58_9BACT|nr:ATP-binding protein [Archangium lansinium]MCY1082735.1 ATP-binding protein [Archangium lansinium]
MWIEGLGIRNIRSFEEETFIFERARGRPYKWVTLLGENGGGKSTVLQTLGLLLAGPEGAQTLLPRPVGLLRNESEPGVMHIRFRRGRNDPGRTKSKLFKYNLGVTGRNRVTVGKQVYTEPTLVSSPAVSGSQLSWLRENVFASRGAGWFAAGYGAFRRLTRSHQVIVPALEPQARYTNFLTQFNEDEPLATFERWMVYLDYVIAKGGAHSKTAERQRTLGIEVINRMLPGGARFDSVTSQGRILFDMGGRKVPTLAMSDGYRSVLALTGDLAWRLMQAFPQRANPLHEEGVVLIDELDIHLHPRWQRHIAGWLREQFPNLQFFVATHSPLVAAGAGDDALTLRLTLEKGVTKVERVETPVALSVDRILQSEAFGQVSPYSPPTQEAIDRYDILARKRKRSPAEEKEFVQLREFMQQARPLGGPPEPGSLDAKLDDYIEKTLRREGRG